MQPGCVVVVVVVRLLVRLGGGVPRISAMIASNLNIVVPVVVLAVVLFVVVE